MNKIVLTGHLGRDAELKYLPEGRNVTKFTLAVNKNYKREGDVPTWFNCEVWNKEKLSNYLTKGKAVLVVGEMRIDPYEKDGQARQKVYVNVENVELLGGDTKANNKVDADNFEYTPPTGLSNDGYGAVDDDDIPF